MTRNESNVHIFMLKAYLLVEFMKLNLKIRKFADDLLQSIQAKRTPMCTEEKIARE